jgi:hypothetical protein
LRLVVTLMLSASLCHHAYSDGDKDKKSWSLKSVSKCGICVAILGGGAGASALAYAAYSAGFFDVSDKEALRLALKGAQLESEELGLPITVLPQTHFSTLFTRKGWAEKQRRPLSKGDLESLTRHRNEVIASQRDIYKEISRSVKEFGNFNIAVFSEGILVGGGEGLLLHIERERSLLMRNSPSPPNKKNRSIEDLIDQSDELALLTKYFPAWLPPAPIEEWSSEQLLTLGVVGAPKVALWNELILDLRPSEDREFNQKGFEYIRARSKGQFMLPHQKHDGERLVHRSRELIALGLILAANKQGELKNKKKILLIFGQDHDFSKYASANIPIEIQR